MTKRCSTCRQVLPLESFNRESKGALGRQSQCRTCQAASNARWREANRERSRQSAREWNRAHPERAAEHHYKARYGITWAEYDALHSAQDGKCAICARPCPTGNRLAVDHDHATGAVRALLCHNCNSGLGKFKDDPALLLIAVEYLAAHGIVTSTPQLHPATSSASPPSPG